MKPSTPNAYLRTKVMTASPQELRLMLLDGAIRFAGRARAAIEASDHEGVYEGVTRARAIVLELLNALAPEHDPELCDRLSALYTYVHGRLVAAASRRDVAILDEVIGLLEYERETWQLAMSRLQERGEAPAPDERPTVCVEG